MEFFICLAFLVAGLAGANRCLTEETYLLGKAGVETRRPIKERYGIYFSRLAALYLLVSFTLFGSILLQEMAGLFGEERIISMAYIELFAVLMLWRGGFFAMVRVTVLLLALLPFYDYPLPFAFIAGCVGLGSLWLIQTNLTIQAFLKPEPKEHFLRAGCIAVIYASLVYFVSSFELSNYRLALLPCVSLIFALVTIGWKRSHYMAAFASAIGTLVVGAFTLDWPLLIAWNLSVGVFTSLFIVPKAVKKTSM